MRIRLPRLGIFFAVAVSGTGTALQWTNGAGIWRLSQRVETSFFLPPLLYDAGTFVANEICDKQEIIIAHRFSSIIPVPIGGRSSHVRPGQSGRTLISLSLG
jgi:hypothetical protein